MVQSIKKKLNIFNAILRGKNETKNMGKGISEHS